MQEARFAAACQDQHAGRPALGLGWPGKRKSIVQQAETSVVSKEIIKVTGPGPEFSGAWGPGLGAGASRTFGAWSDQFFVVLKKSFGGRQAKGWETAETAAAEVGAWREAGTGYPAYPPLPRPPPPPRF